MLGGLQTIFSFDHSLGLTELRKIVYSWLQFAAGKEYRLKSENGEDAESRVLEKPGSGFHFFSPSGVT